MSRGSMRTNLLHPLRERAEGPTRTERRHSERRSKQRRAEPPRRIVVEETPVEAGLPPDCDPAVARVRQAGGPLDQAVYTCGCGYLFSAPVSTTVACPHCGTGQAW